MFVCPVNVMRRAIQFIIQTDGPDIELQRYCFPFYAFAKKKQYMVSIVPTKLSENGIHKTFIY